VSVINHRGQRVEFEHRAQRVLLAMCRSKVVLTTEITELKITQSTLLCTAYRIPLTAYRLQVSANNT